MYRPKYTGYTRHIANAVLSSAVNAPSYKLPSEVFEKNKLLAKSMASRKSATYAKKYRRRNKRRRIVRFRRAPLNTPNSITRRIVHTFRANIDAGVGSAIGSQVFALNGCYDPTLALAAGQPLYFDQYMTLYQQYCVLGFKVLVECCCTDNTNPIVIGFTPMTTSTPFTVPEHYIEAKGTTHRIMTPDVDKIAFANKGSVRKWLLPRGGKLTTNDTYCGTSSANPTTVLFGHLWAAALTYTGVDPSAVPYIIRIEQIVKFFNPITPARS